MEVAREADEMRGIRFGVVVAGVAVLAAGCGTVRAGSGGGTPASLTAAARSTSARTARVAETTTMRLGGMTVSYTAAGEFDFAHARGTLSMHAPAGMTMRFLPPKVYVQVPDGAVSGLPKGKAWVALGTGDLGGSAVPGLGAFGASSPADLLASLRSISGSVKKLGAGTVRGVAVTGYRVIIDPLKAAKAARLPAAERASSRRFAASLGAGAISADVWVDGGNLVRRVTLSLRLPAALSAGPGGAAKGKGTAGMTGATFAGLGSAAKGKGAAKGTGVTETTDFYDFGVPVRVSPPPAARVISLGQLGAGSGSAASGSGSFTAGPPGAPPVSGTLTQAQATAAKRAVIAFFTALGRNDTAAAARTVVPAQRSCATAVLKGAPEITVKSLRISSAAPAGPGKATVLFTVSASGRLGGASIPVVPPGSDGKQWLAAAGASGHWYVDLAASADFLFGGAC